MKSIGQIISIDDINNKKLSLFNFIISFDDVSSTIKNITPYLFNNKIPFIISPCTSITTDGYGIRDKVYFIIKNISKDEIYNFVSERFINKKKLKKDNFSFYHFSKSSEIDNIFMEDEIIDPLFESIKNTKNNLKDYKAYLSWKDIKKDYLNNKLVTISNHSHSHRNMINQSKRQIEEEIEISTNVFWKKLNFRPKYFTVPFGNYDEELSVNLDCILKNFDYKSKLWVNVKNQSMYVENKLFDYFKIHTPNSIPRFIYSIFSNINISKNSNKRHGNYQA